MSSEELASEQRQLLEDGAHLVLVFIQGLVFQGLLDKSRSGGLGANHVLDSEYPLVTRRRTRQRPEDALSEFLEALGRWIGILAIRPLTPHATSVCPLAENGALPHLEAASLLVQVAEGLAGLGHPLADRLVVLAHGLVVLLGPLARGLVRLPRLRSHRLEATRDSLDQILDEILLGCGRHASPDSLHSLHSGRWARWARGHLSQNRYGIVSFCGFSCATSP